MYKIKPLHEILLIRSEKKSILIIIKNPFPAKEKDQSIFYHHLLYTIIQ